MSIYPCPRCMAILEPKEDWKCPFCSECLLDMSSTDKSIEQNKEIWQELADE